MRNISIFSLVLIFTICIISPAFSQQETITITTYYPAPFGVYNNLRLFPTTTVPACDANNEGIMYYDNNAGVNQLMVCRETAPGVYGWGVGGSNWTHPAQTNILHPNDLNWRVGIGTDTPWSTLHVHTPNEPTIPGGATHLALSGQDSPVSVPPNENYSTIVFHDNTADTTNFWAIAHKFRPGTSTENALHFDYWPTPGTRFSAMSLAANGNVGIGNWFEGNAPQAQLDVAGTIKISGTAGTDGIIYPDGTKQTSAKLSCVTNTNGWGPIVNGQTYSVACPADYVGVHGRFEYYDTNSVVGGGGGTLKYHGLSPCTWNAARTTCSVTPNDAGISEGQVFVDCCRIP